jgi:SAM-dependent methyltransferase
VITDQEPDVPYRPMPADLVERVLQVAEVKPGDLVYDLGCGDGRIVIAAAKNYGARGIGFEIDAELVRQARANARSAGVDGRVAIQHADIFTLDLSGADVVTLYLLSIVNERLIPQLQRMRAGARIVSVEFAIKGFSAEETVVMDCSDRRKRDIYLWTAPLGSKLKK